MDRSVFFPGTSPFLAFVPGKVIPQLFAVFLGYLVQLDHLFRVLCNHVVAFSRISPQVVKFGSGQSDVRKISRLSVIPGIICSVCHVFVWEYQFELTVRHGFQVVLVVVIDK